MDETKRDLLKAWLIKAQHDLAAARKLSEDLLRSFLMKKEKPDYDLYELELINKNAERLNQETEDVLTYQIHP
jgi:hypothetical protein